MLVLVDGKYNTFSSILTAFLKCKKNLYFPLLDLFHLVKPFSKLQCNITFRSKLIYLKPVSFICRNLPDLRDGHDHSLRHYDSYCPQFLLQRSQSYRGSSMGEKVQLLFSHFLVLYLFEYFFSAKLNSKEI